MTGHGDGDVLPVSFVIVAAVVEGIEEPVLDQELVQGWGDAGPANLVNEGMRIDPGPFG